jgi:hypothetical protein
MASFIRRRDYINYLQTRSLMRQGVKDSNPTCINPTSGAQD